LIVILPVRPLQSARRHNAALPLFRGKARCSRCHTFSERSPFFTNFDYINTGVATNHPAFEKMSRVLFDCRHQPRAENRW
jgi:cytochrome c peroxidase